MRRAVCVLAVTLLVMSLIGGAVAVVGPGQPSFYTGDDGQSPRSPMAPHLHAS
jgi:hypothetical protein